MTMQDVFKHARHDWTRERIERLPAAEIKQLGENAERLGEAELAALCGELLKTARRTKPGQPNGTARNPWPKKR